MYKCVEQKNAENPDNFTQGGADIYNKLYKNLYLSFNN